MKYVFRLSSAAAGRTTNNVMGSGHGLSQRVPFNVSGIVQESSDEAANAVAKIHHIILSMASRDVAESLANIPTGRMLALSRC